MRRVVQTFRAVQALQHPHICPVYFLDEFPQFGQVLGMKFLDGLTLLDYRDQYVDEHGEFPVEEVVRILRPVAAALDYAHNPSVVHPEVEKPVIHRDIKPENILVSADGSSEQIVDFGLVEQVRMSVRPDGFRTIASGIRRSFKGPSINSLSVRSQLFCYGRRMLCRRFRVYRRVFDCVNQLDVRLY
jgi:serine/threonine protein kinase